MSTTYQMLGKGYRAFFLSCVTVLFSTINYAQVNNKSKIEPVKPAIKNYTSRLTQTKFLLKDSNYRYWMWAGPGPENFSSDRFAADSSGTIYCSIYNSSEFLAKGFQVLRLMNGNWERFLPAAEKVTKLANFIYDGRGGLYLKTENSLYELKKKSWQAVFKKDSLRPSTPTPELDGKFYAALKDSLEGKETARLVRYEKGSYVNIGPSGKPLHLQSVLDQYKIDGKGTVYSYRGFSSDIEGPAHIKRWDGDDWALIGTVPETIYDFEFDKNQNLYVYGFGKNTPRYFKKWDGKDWTDIPIPGEGSFQTPMFDAWQTIYTKAYINGKGYALYKLVNDNWVEIAKEGSSVSFSSRDFIPAAGRIYAYGCPFLSGNYNEIYYYNATGSSVKTETWVDNIPIKNSSGQITDKTYAALNDHFLFEKDGKLGVINRKGFIKILPVFDRIVIRSTPNHLLSMGFDEALIRDPDESGYCIELNAGTDTLYVNLYDVVNGYGSNSLRGFKEKTIRINCSRCNGYGKSRDTKTTTEYREWVPGEKYYVKTLTVNGWKREIINYPGFYKTTKKEETVTPGAICKDCSGKGHLAVYSKQQYSFDDKKKKYIINWIK